MIKCDDDGTCGCHIYGYEWEYSSPSQTSAVHGHIMSSVESDEVQAERLKRRRECNRLCRQTETAEQRDTRGSILSIYQNMVIAAIVPAFW